MWFANSRGTLANELGNLVHRILTLSRKNLEEACSAQDLASSDADLDDHPANLSESACSTCSTVGGAKSRPLGPKVPFVRCVLRPCGLQQPSLATTSSWTSPRSAQSLGCSHASTTGRQLLSHAGRPGGSRDCAGRQSEDDPGVKGHTKTAFMTFRVPSAVFFLPVPRLPWLPWLPWSG